MSETPKNNAEAEAKNGKDQGTGPEKDCSVSELVKMAQALSEGDFNRQFEQHFQGELGQLASYLESMRQNLTALAPSVSDSAGLMPKAASDVAEISQDAEVSVNSILELVEGMFTDQEKILEILAGAEGGNGLDIPNLRDIADKNRKSLMSLIGYLSFQDVLRQRAEKVREMIQEFEQKVVELLVKFKVKVNTQAIKEGDGREVMRGQVKDLSGDMGLDQSLVDELLEGL